MIEIVRRSDGARPLVPMLLVKCYPLETLGRLEEAAELCDAAVEATRLDGAAHFLPWALFERAWAHYYLGELGAAIACAEESMRISRTERSAARARAPASGRRGCSRCALIESGRARAGRGAAAAARRRGHRGRDARRARLLLGDARARGDRRPGNPERAERYVRASRRRRRGDGPVDSPRHRAARPRGADASRPATRRRCAELAAASADAFASIGARIEVAFSRSLQGRALAEASERKAADRRSCERPRPSSTRAAPRASGTPPGASCASSAPAPRSADPRRGAEAGLDALTEREREDRRPRHRPPHQPRDRRRALPQREDHRVPPAQRVREARGLLARRGRPHGRAIAKRRRVSAAQLGIRTPVSGLRIGSGRPFEVDLVPT